MGNFFLKKGIRKVGPREIFSVPPNSVPSLRLRSEKQKSSSWVQRQRSCGVLGRNLCYNSSGKGQFPPRTYMCYAYLHINVCIHTYIHIQTYIYRHTYIYIHAYRYVHTCIFACICIYVCITDVYLYVFMRAYYVCMYTYV